MLLTQMNIFSLLVFNGHHKFLGNPSLPWTHEINRDFKNIPLWTWKSQSCHIPEKPQLKIPSGSDSSSRSSPFLWWDLGSMGLQWPQCPTECPRSIPRFGAGKSQSSAPSPPFPAHLCIPGAAQTSIHGGFCGLSSEGNLNPRKNPNPSLGVK